MLTREQCQTDKRKVASAFVRVARSAGVYLVRANVIGLRSFIPPAMFDLESEWTTGVGGGERARRRLPEEIVEKQNTPWFSYTPLYFENDQVTNQIEIN